MKKILILGSSGTIGSSLVKTLQSESQLGKFNLLAPKRNELNLVNYEQVVNLFCEFEPDYVINAAGKVAGIAGNIRNPADMILTNITINNNILHAALYSDTERYFQYSSACIYPINSVSNSRIEDLFSGRPEESSLSYAVAKIAGLQSVLAINEQYNKNWITIIPSNLFGPGDWSHGEDDHVIAMLSRKFYKAKLNGLPEVHIWGDGTPTRNFIYVDDLTDATVKLLNLGNELNSVINVSTPMSVSIRELANMIALKFKYEGNIIYDTEKPNGAPKKSLDDSYIRSLGWCNKFDLDQSLDEYLKFFIASQ